MPQLPLISAQPKLQELVFLALLSRFLPRRSPFMAKNNASVPFVFSVALDTNTIQAQSLSFHLTKN
ncbi:hypothetical protein PPIS_a0062 [Pseudoalteromonas piscicida]|uniref:Uncharacterized protein n=1 Tax=Pseudoalteromonas piscicida TaxID=43662 RepID=A0ABN5C825_PSEO7|nr:hypothetical protein PPIS_a0062 [Pseudoalteromonas piscicida]